MWKKHKIQNGLQDDKMADNPTDHNSNALLKNVGDTL